MFPFISCMSNIILHGDCVASQKVFKSTSRYKVTTGYKNDSDIVEVILHHCNIHFDRTGTKGFNVDDDM